MRSVSFSAIVFCLSASSCGGSPTGPGDSAPALTQVTNSAHYIFRSAAGDSVDATWQDQYFEWVTGVLELDPSTRLEYLKYRDRSHLKAITGRDTNGFAEPGTTRFHTIWPIDNHEGVHTLVILQVGHPPALFNEGVAVAHHTDPARGLLVPRWNGTDLRTLARNYDAAGQLPPLPSLLRSTSFFDYDTNITYPCAGSFVRYLIDTHGLASFKAYVRAARFDDPPATTEARFEAAYGRSAAAAWDEWRASLRRPDADFSLERASARQRQTLRVMR